jgi:hypothetical protein
MQRQASSNWPSLAWACAKNDVCNGVQAVAPVDRQCCHPTGNGLNRLSGTVAQDQHAALLNGSLRLAERRTFFISQGDKFVGERVRHNVVPTEDTGIIWNSQCHHQSANVADLTRLLRAVNIDLRGLRIATNQSGNARKDKAATRDYTKSRYQRTLLGRIVKGERLIEARSA